MIDARSTSFRGILALLCVILLSGWEADACAQDAITISSDFPGGNILIDSIQDGQVRLRQDERDTPRFWFYWCFEVRGAEGRTLTFTFTKGKVFGSRGPAVSTDQGKTWSWLGTEACEGDSFQYVFRPEDHRVRFAFSIPYTAANLQDFLARHENHPSLRRSELVQTPRRHSVDLLTTGRLDGQAKHRVLLTCRHHASESIANFVLEGLLDAVLADTDQGCWFRDQTEIIAVPFMDKAGVEAGDQGKLRSPHDHWLDYREESLYAETRALRTLIEAESRERPIDIALDLHCPYLRDTKIYFALGADPNIAESTTRFCRLFEQRQQGPLKYVSNDNSLFGTGWNVAATYEGRRSFWQWAETLPEIQAVATLEMPYASVGNLAVTPEAARAVGSDLAEAIAAFLRESSR